MVRVLHNWSNDDELHNRFEVRQFLTYNLDRTVKPPPNLRLNENYVSHTSISLLRNIIVKYIIYTYLSCESYVKLCIRKKPFFEFIGNQTSKVVFSSAFF